MLFKRPQFKRSIKTDILLQNIIAIILIVATIIVYTYSSSTKATILKAQDHIRSATTFISGKIAFSLSVAENYVDSIVPILETLDLKNYAFNKDMYESFQCILEENKHLTTFFYGTEDGTLIEYGPLKTMEDSLRSLNINPLEGSLGIVRVIFRDINTQSQQVPETWYFLGKNKNVSQPIYQQITKYDPRNRGWYQESAKTQDLIWSKVYTFMAALNGKQGITASKAILNNDGTLKGVFGVDITLESFSEFLAKSKPSENGHIYILDKNHKIISASKKENEFIEHGVSFELKNAEKYGLKDLQCAVEHFHQHSESDEFTTFELDGIEYLAFKTDFPKKLPDELFIIAISPLDDFVNHIKQIRKSNILLLIFIGLLASISSFILAHGISNPIRKLSKEANKIKDLDFGESPIIKSNIKEIQDLNTSIAALKTSIQSFSYYIPKNMVKRLMLRKQAIHMGGRKKEVTLFFSDIEGFTTISETMNAEHLSMHLCDYFDALGNIITHHDGTIDKFIGDSIMAFWGAPITDRYHSRNACKAALECQRKLSSINRIWKNEGKSQLKTRIGIHTGEVIIGNIGSSERMNYTAMGDNVNFCSRLEGLNKVYGTKIIISETVVGELKNHFYIRSLDNVIVKGKTKPLRIYELVGLKNDDPSFLPSDETINFNEHFEQAYHLYLTRQFKDALKKFKEINDNLRTNDLSVLLYIERCGEFIKNPPPKDWDGAYQHTHK